MEYFEIRILKKKNEELLQKVPSKIYGVFLLWKKTKQNFGLLIFLNIITEQWGYCWLVDARISASETDLSVMGKF